MNWILRFSYVVLLMGMALTTQAQYGSRFQLKGHEIGLEPLALRYVPAYTAGYDGPVPFSVHALHGVRYKFHMGMDDGIRIGVFRQQQDYLEPTGPSVERQATQLQIGYERKVIRGYQMFFGGVDALFNQGMMSWMPHDDTEPPISLGDSGYQNFGAYAFGGYRLFFSPYLSATVEVGATYSRTRYDLFRPEASGSSPYLFPQQEFGIQASVYLSAHFGKIPKRCTCPRH